MTCWNCERDAHDAAVCGFCGRLQPVARGTDHFAVMALPRQYAVARDEVDAKFRELSRRFHPDRFTRESADERRIAMQRTVALNDAYRVLRDDVRRGEYLLKLLGIDVGAEKTGSAKEMGLDNAFLMEMLERREALGEARAAGDREAEARLFAEVRRERDAALLRAAAGLGEEAGKENMHHRATENTEEDTEKKNRSERRVEASGRLSEVAREFAKIRYYARFLGEAADD